MEQIPHHLEVVVHFTPAAHHIAQAGNIRAIACAAWNRVFFEYVDVIAGHLRIAYQVAGCGERGQPRADDVRVLVVDARRLLWTGECFVIAAGIVHGFLLWKRFVLLPLCASATGFALNR